MKSNEHKGKKVYLACPYTHDDIQVQMRRFQEISRIAGHLMAEGIIVFSPISHNHTAALDMGLPTDWEFWEKFDLSFIEEWCDELWVVKLDGDAWEHSVGVQAEIQIALKAGKVVRTIDPAEKPLTGEQLPIEPVLEKLEREATQSDDGIIRCWEDYQRWCKTDEAEKPGGVLILSTEFSKTFYANDTQVAEAISLLEEDTRGRYIREQVLAVLKGGE